MNQDGVFLKSALQKRIPSYYRPPLLITLLFLIWVWARYIQIGVRAGGIFGAIRFEFLLGGVLIVLSIWVLLQAPLEVRRSKSIVVGILLLFFAMIIQIPLAALPPLAWDIFFDRVIKFASLTFFMVALIRSPQALRWFVIVWMISIFWITQESVRGLITGNLYWQNQGVMRLHGAVPIYGGPNSLGGVSMGAVPFIVFLWPVWRRWWQRACMLALLTTALICVIYSGSRTAYVALVAFLVFWFMRSKLKWRFLFKVFTLGSVILLLLPDQYIERFKSIGGEEAEGQSKQARIEILEDAWEIFREYPIGVGLGCFPVVRAQKFGRSQDTHNLYFEVATNLGIQGFTVFSYFIWVLIAAFFSAHKFYRRQFDNMSRLSSEDMPHALFKQLEKQMVDLKFLLAVANAGAGFIFIRLVLGLFGMDLYEIYWWFGAGLSICMLEMINTIENRSLYLRYRLWGPSDVRA